LLTYKCTYRGGFNLGTILFTERYKENRQTLNKKESIVETVSNVTVSVLTSGITMATVGTLLGVISTHRLLSQLGYFLGRGTRRSGLGYGCRPRPAHTPGKRSKK